MGVRVVVQGKKAAPPHAEFWGGLAGLLKDGVAFTLRGFKVFRQDIPVPI